VPKSKLYHVVPSPDGGWSVRREGAERSSRVFSRQVDAIEHARDLVRNSGSELVVHGRDGRIRESATYGHDPFPPLDRPQDRSDQTRPKGFGALRGELKVRSDVDVTKPIYQQVTKEPTKQSHRSRTK
jgi:hypothetical protein